jgi:uncharacterized membrane-anchored protein
MKLRLVILWLVAVGGLLFVNYAIYGKEQLIRNGQPIFLELAPVDPRSLIQGDYMALRYKIAADLESTELPPRGKLVINVADNGIASFVRVDDGAPLAADERLLTYYKHDWQIDLGPTSFFFQEGTAEDYEEAKYGELRVDASGTSILVGLRGENLEALGVPQ